MKKERKGCLFGLLGWLARVAFSVFLAGLAVALIAHLCYQHIKPFRALVNQTPIVHLDKKEGLPRVTVELPNASNGEAKGGGKTVEVKGLLPFESKKQVELGKLDLLGRATSAHIQLKKSDEPKQKRETRLTYNPPGWHNYKLEVLPNQKAWVMNRGHLVGYQFSGLNNEPKNLVAETAWVNQGSDTKMDDTNSQAMLYYENRLEKWLSQHTKDYLDYKVTPIYTGSELLPRSIKLEYVGLTTQGKAIPIQLGGNLEKNVNGKTQVVLENRSPKLNINYQKGTVTLK